MRGLVAMAAVATLSCNSIAGLDGLEKVDCVENCSGTGGAGGTGALAPESVWVGRKSSCVVMNDKSLRCWGANPGTLPGTLSSAPVLVDTLKDVATLSLGLGHSCAVDGSGVVWCWGANDYGQLGDGSTTPSPEPKAVPGLPAIDTVSAGATHTCAYSSPDADPVQAFCWGRNDFGQLGDGTTTDSLNPLKLTLPNGGKIFRMSPGAGFTPAIVSAGGVLEAWCWGKNDKGQCGQPTSTAVVATPTKIPNVPQLERVYGGTDHVCSRTVGTKIPWCWGANENGQLGVGTSSASGAPNAVPGSVTIDTMYVGSRHSCLIKSATTTADCWGANDLGQFGGPIGLDVLTPTAAPYLDGGQTAMRQAEHGCRLLNGVVTCFGANESGQLGNGKTETFSPPTQVDLGP
jgi:alpha-tubulin suppressor-like RCC1 family protein